MLPVDVAWSSSVAVTIGYILPVLWGMTCLPVICQAKATQVECLLTVSHQGTEHDGVYPNWLSIGQHRTRDGV